MTDLKHVVPLGALVAILLGVLVALGFFIPETARAPQIGPDAEGTDVVMAGPALFESTGAQDKIYVGDEDGRRTELILDAESICASPTGAHPCIAMSALYSMAFKDAFLMVEGNWQGSAILVKKLSVLRNGESPQPLEPGNVYIPWTEAQRLISTCQVSMIMQTHALDVHLTLKDGREVVSVESVIDEVFNVYNDSQAKCGAIPLATE